MPLHPERLEQVLLNLLMNAADVVLKPGGQVSLAAERVDDGVRIDAEEGKLGARFVIHLPASSAPAASDFRGTSSRALTNTPRCARFVRARW